MEQWSKKIHVQSSLPPKEGQFAMFIGRWQPLHDGHKALFKQAMDEGKNVLICIRDIEPDEKNPFTASEVKENIMEQYPQGRVSPIITLRLNKMILEVDGISDRGEIAKFVDSMPIMDSKYIRNFLYENEPRLDLTKEVIAPSGERAVVNIAFGVEFFRPFFTV